MARKRNDALITGILITVSLSTVILYFFGLAIALGLHEYLRHCLHVPNTFIATIAVGGILSTGIGAICSSVVFVRAKNSFLKVSSAMLVIINGYFVLDSIARVVYWRIL